MKPEKDRVNTIEPSPCVPLVFHRHRKRTVTLYQNYGSFLKLTPNFNTMLLSGAFA